MDKPLRVTIDIEISPNTTKTYEPYDARILKIVENQFLYSIAEKWDGGKTIVTALPDFKLYKRNKRDDRALIKHCWDILDRANIVVGHNIKNFDLKKLNARFAYHGLGSPSPYFIQDTLLDARRYFSYPGGNSLGELARYHSIENKLHVEPHVWDSCERGDMKAWKEACIYNARDVDITEEIYNIQLPFVTKSFNMGVLLDKRGVCPSCGEDRLIRHKERFTKAGVKVQYYCRACGSYHSDARTTVTSSLR